MTLRQTSPSGLVTDTRATRLAAIYVGAGSPPSPFLAAGPFHATMTGYFKLKLKGDYQIRLAGRGAVVISLNGREVLRADQGDLSQAAPAGVALIKGYNRLRIEYDSPPDGAAQLRTYWSGEDFAWEPLYPMMLMHNGADEAATQGRTVRRGRLLLARHNCLKCHTAPPGVDLSPKETGLPNPGMPELGRDAPSLSGVGSRLDADWIAALILNPRCVRGRPTMPRVLAGVDDATAKQRAADIAAYLSTLRSDGASPASTAGSALAEEGEILFEDRGCIACHRFTAPGPQEDEEDDYDRISLHYVGWKFRPGALAAFLRNVRANYRWSRMPAPELSEEEASALAAFVRSRSKGTIEKPAAAQPGDSKRGRQLFGASGCVNCHSLGKDDPPKSVVAPELFGADHTAGCLAAERSSDFNAPDFGFGDADREAIRGFLRSDAASLGRLAPAEFSLRQFESCRCSACHTRDDEDAQLPYVLEDEGSRGLPPDPIPILTWAGEKLRTDWMASLFAGTLGYRTRAHFKARMPTLPVRGDRMALGLAADHGYAPGEDVRPPHDAELAAMGKKLTAMDTGFSCNRCHAMADKEAVAPFDAHATNLAYAARRLRHEYFSRWVLNPVRVDPSTKMLQFAPDGKRTTLVKYYDGDAQKQFRALWNFLETLSREYAAKKRRQGPFAPR